MEAAIKQSEDTVLRRINIVSWDSPVAKQHSIRSIPHFVMFDTRGRKVAEGKDVLKRVQQSATVASSRDARTKGRTERVRKRGGSSVRTVVRNGDRIRLTTVLARGQYTVFEFYADWCHACEELAPKLETMANETDGVALRRINIKDWESPVAKQYEIKSLPHLIMFDKKGKQVAEGRDQVVRRMVDLQRAAATPGR